MEASLRRMQPESLGALICLLFFLLLHLRLLLPPSLPPHPSLEFIVIVFLVSFGSKPYVRFRSCTPRKNMPTEYGGSNERKKQKYSARYFQA